MGKRVRDCNPRGVLEPEVLVVVSEATAQEELVASSESAAVASDTTTRTSGTSATVAIENDKRVSDMVSVSPPLPNFWCTADFPLPIGVRRLLADYTLTQNHY